MIPVCIPSYKRTFIKTLEFYPKAKVFVCETEIDEYRKANPETDFVVCPKGVQGNLCRVKNYMLDTLFPDYEAVCIIDDDVTGIYGYSSTKAELGIYGYCRELVSDFDSFLENYTDMCNGFGFKMWGVNINFDPACYMQFKPFSTTCYIGGAVFCPHQKPYKI